MATKAEQEADYRHYEAAVHMANIALAAGDARDAVRHALLAIDILDGAVAYARRYLKLDPFGHHAHELLFRLAPLLFDTATLDAIETQLDGNRKLERVSDFPFRQRLIEARQRLSENARLWDSLPTATKDPESARTLAFWAEAGCVTRDGTTFRQTFVPDEPCRGKCPYCGALCGGKKVSLCRERPCPKCGAIAFLVILPASVA